MNRQVRFLGIDARIGFAIPRRISERRERFHRQIASACLQREDAELEHVGETTIAAISLSDVFRRTDGPILELRDKLLAHGQLEVAIIDFSDSGTAMQRDIFVGGLVDMMLQLSAAGSCRRYALLLPYSVRSWENIATDLRSPETARSLNPPELALAEWHAAGGSGELFVLNASGEAHHYPSGEVDERLGELYKTARRPMEDSAEAAVTRGLVRRLGHFPASPKGASQCRRYSYLIDRRVSDLATVYLERVKEIGVEPGVVIFDVGQSPWSHLPIATAADALGVPFFPIGELENKSTRRRALRNIRARCITNPALLMVDVVDSSATVKGHVALLRKLGVPCAPGIVAAVGIDGRRKFVIDGASYDIYPCVSTDQRHYSSGDCPQCELDLPLTPEADDPEPGLRSYDFWDMANEQVWHPELDPAAGREPLASIPDFEAMLGKRGDWLGYKMAKRLESLGMVHFSVAYIEQAGAKAVADKLKLRLPRSVQFISIPEDIVDQVRAGEDLKRISQTAAERRDPWFEQLERLRMAPMVVIDIFSVSGGTLTALRMLFEAMQLNVRAVFPMIDLQSAATRLSEPLLTLYSWPIKGGPGATA